MALPSNDEYVLNDALTKIADAKTLCCHAQCHYKRALSLADAHPSRSFEFSGLLNDDSASLGKGVRESQIGTDNLQTSFVLIHGSSFLTENYPVLTVQKNSIPFMTFEAATPARGNGTMSRRDYVLRYALRCEEISNHQLRFLEAVEVQVRAQTTRTIPLSKNDKKEEPSFRVNYHLHHHLRHSSMHDPQIDPGDSQPELDPIPFSHPVTPDTFIGRLSKDKGCKSLKSRSLVLAESPVSTLRNEESSIPILLMPPANTVKAMNSAPKMILSSTIDAHSTAMPDEVLTNARIGITSRVGNRQSLQDPSRSSDVPGDGVGAPFMSAAIPRRMKANTNTTPPKVQLSDHSCIAKHHLGGHTQGYPQQASMFHPTQYHPPYQLQHQQQQCFPQYHPQQYAQGPRPLNPQKYPQMHPVQHLQGTRLAQHAPAQMHPQPQMLYPHEDVHRIAQGSSTQPPGGMGLQKLLTKSNPLPKPPPVYPQHDAQKAITEGYSLPELDNSNNSAQSSPPNIAEPRRSSRKRSRKRTAKNYDESGCDARAPVDLMALALGGRDDFVKMDSVLESRQRQRHRSLNDSLASTAAATAASTGTEARNSTQSLHGTNTNHENEMYDDFLWQRSHSY